MEKIDLEVFVTLTGEDLLELKIKAFGARKKLLLAINQLKAETSLFPNDRVKLSFFKDVPSLLTHLNMGDHIGSVNFFINL